MDRTGEDPAAADAELPGCAAEAWIWTVEELIVVCIPFDAGPRADVEWWRAGQNRSGGRKSR